MRIYLLPSYVDSWGFEQDETHGPGFTFSLKIIPHSPPEVNS